MERITMEQYVEACKYPGTIDDDAVGVALADYCKSLGITRTIKRIRHPWHDDQGLQSIVDAAIGAIPTSERAARDARAALDALAARDARAALDALAARDARAALDALAARDARAARAAGDALDAQAARAARAAGDARAALDARAAGDAAIRRFSAWCVWASGGYWYWDLSWVSSVYFGANQTRSRKVLEWLSCVCRAFISGAWFLVWTEHTLYWVAKPTMHLSAQVRALHREDGPALECDVENLYYIRGVCVGADVVMTPHLLTVKQIDEEQDNDVRGIMLERFGMGRYLLDSGAKVLDEGKNDIEGTHEALMQTPNGRKFFWPTCPSGRICPPLPVPNEINNRDQARNWFSGNKPFRILART
jgi:hypothetical protein